MIVSDDWCIQMSKLTELIETELGSKQWCVLYVALFVALGAGVGVGVPLALRSSSSLHDRLNTVHNILAQVPLVDG